MYHKFELPARQAAMLQCRSHMVHKPGPIAYTLAGLAGIGVIAIGFLGMRTWDQSKQLTGMEAELERRATVIENQQSALAVASTTIASLRNDLEQVREDLEDLADDYRNEQNKNEEFEDQIRDLAGTLGDLKRLEEIDEELLAKYSKVYFLNENYIPSRIKQINEDFILPGKSDQYFHAEAIKFLEDMIERAERDGHDLKVVSAYRSFDEQREVKNGHTTVFGSGANAFSADQGYSEHQLGTTVDLTTPAVGGTYTSFGDTEAFAWLQENAWRYGFILSYPEGNEFYVYEPWHWRFVGRDLARHLNRSDETFYTMDQREINEYLLELFD